MDILHRFVFEHRRLLSAIATGLAVLAALSAVREESPSGTRVVVASHDLASGHVVRAADLETRLLPASSLPAHPLGRSAAVGRRVAGPMRQGEALTDYRVLRPDSLRGYGPDAVLTTVRVAEADGVTGVQVGDRIDVIAVDPDGESKAAVVARKVEVVTVPASSSDSDATPLGIVTTEPVALALATAALESRFSVVSSSK
jgi:Flp pilus assembly protein CpaB